LIKKTIIASQDLRLQEALEFLFETEPSALIAGTSNTAADLLVQTQATKPDLILLDWDLNGQMGTDLLTDLHRINPTVKTIVFSNTGAEPKVRSTGVDVCIAKGSLPDAILKNFRRLFEVTTPI
jgi:DNA-binding NarL/FixJ family response regulator